LIISSLAISESIERELGDKDITRIHKILKSVGVKFDNKFDNARSKLVQSFGEKKISNFVYFDSFVSSKHYCRAKVQHFIFNKRTSRLLHDIGTTNYVKRNIGNNCSNYISDNYIKTESAVLPDFFLDLVFDFFELRKFNDKDGHSYKLSEVNQFAAGKRYGRSYFQLKIHVDKSNEKPYMRDFYKMILFDVVKGEIFVIDELTSI